MKVKIKNKRSLIAVAIILGLVAIGGVIAYHTSQGLFINDFHAAETNWSAIDEFVSPNDWKHCDRTPKIIKAKNNSGSPVSIRIKLEEYWKKAGSTSTNHETELPLTLNGTKLTYYNLNQSNEWAAEEGGWYRYVRPLEANEETTPLITYVDFSCEAEQIFENTDCETVNNQTVCTKNQNDYNNAKYHLYATIQSTAVASNDRLKIAKLFGAGDINTHIKRLANPDADEIGVGYYDSNVKAIRTASSLPDGFVAEDKNIFSDYWSDYPIYGWYETNTGIFYLYTEADYIAAPSDLNWAFAHFHALTDISGLANWHTNNVTSMDCMFYESGSIQNVNALARWDTSNNTSLSWTFHSTANLADISGLANWRVDKVSNFYNALAESGFTDTTPLLHWNTASATTMTYMFYDDPITNSVGFTYWDVSHVTSTSLMFAWCDIRDMNGFRNWDTSGITEASCMFEGNYNVTSLIPLFNWQTTNLTVSDDMFYGISANVTRPAWYQ